MGIISAAVKHMMAAGMPNDAILAAIEDMERGHQVDEQAERRRATDRDRKRQKRLRNSAESADVADVPRVGVMRVEDKPLPQRIEPQEQEGKKGARAALDPSGFDEFWALFPNQVGKAAARKAWPAAVAKAGVPVIIAGLRRYASKTDDRPWCNPATFLNQERWDDAPATVIPMARHGPGPPTKPRLEDLYAFRESRENEPERQALETTFRHVPAAVRQ